MPESNFHPYFCDFMIFSKSFGYALRGILYVALEEKQKKKVQLDEIAGKLGVPRYFLGKVMKRLVKEGILDSLKGPYGGFYLNENTLQTRLIQLVEITGKAKSSAVAPFACENAMPKIPARFIMK